MDVRPNKRHRKEDALVAQVEHNCNNCFVETSTCDRFDVSLALGQALKRRWRDAWNQAHTTVCIVGVCSRLRMQLLLLCQLATIKAIKAVTAGPDLKL